jgi:hypothetical protein
MSSGRRSSPLKGRDFVHDATMTADEGNGAAAAAAVPVVVEVLVLSVDGDTLTFRTARRPLPASVDPDTVARQASGLTPQTRDGLLHSTSWRYEQDRVVLTYVAIPDVDPGAARQPVAEAIVRGEDATDPSPDVDGAEVAAHACRHLAFLDRTDVDVAAALAHHRGVRRLVRRYVPDVAGQAAEAD